MQDKYTPEQIDKLFETVMDDSDIYFHNKCNEYSEQCTETMNGIEVLNNNKMSKMTAKASYETSSMILKEVLKSILCE